MNAILSIIKAIPTAISIIQALVSLVKQLREMAHKKATEDMAKAETVEEVKEALGDVAKNP
jgi:hypothetical protein